MPQDEIEWARSGERGVEARGGSPTRTKKRGLARIFSPKKIRRTVAGNGGGTVVTSSAGSKSRLRKTPMITTTISGEAHPTGQRTRVMDMKMSLTRQRRDGGAGE